MNKARLIGLAAATAAVSAVLTPAAYATTEHCDLEGGMKYEINGPSSIDAGDLPDGTPVCIKAGTQTYYTEVSGGMITNDEIMNKPGNAYLGISYIVVYGGYEPPS